MQLNFTEAQFSENLHPESLNSVIFLTFLFIIILWMRVRFCFEFFLCKKVGPNTELMTVDDEHLEGRYVGLNLF